MNTSKSRHATRAAITTLTTVERPRLLTVTQAAAISGESKWTWRARAYRGVCASVKIGGVKSRLLIPEAEVLRLIQQGTRPAVVV
jgi:hypothetical protein